MCWDVKTASEKPLRYQTVNVHDALISVTKTEERHIPEIAHEALTLPQQLKDFSFLVSLVVWYNVLFQIKVVQKSMQSQNFDVSKPVELLDGCYEFLQKNIQKTVYTDIFQQLWNLPVIFK
jgi:hypothetical protein